MRILCFNCKSSKDYVLLLKCINEHTHALPFDYIFFTPSRYHFYLFVFNFCLYLCFRFLFLNLIIFFFLLSRISTYESKNDKSNILSYNFDSKIAGPLGMLSNILKFNILKFSCKKFSFFQINYYLHDCR